MFTGNVAKRLDERVHKYDNRLVFPISYVPSARNQKVKWGVLVVLDMAQDQNEDSMFTKKYTTEMVYDAFDEIPYPIVFTSDIKDAVGCGRETARTRLMDLLKERRVYRRKTENDRLSIWWRDDYQAAFEELTDTPATNETDEQ